jgi:hypothetical protein
VIATLTWKEFREHRSIWLALAGLAVATLVALRALLAPNGVQDLGPGNMIMFVATAVALVAMYGLVCGAMMLAGERESRTLPFLDTLPVARSALWRGKALAGGLFTLAHSLVVVAVVVALGLAGTDEALPPFWILALPLVGLEAFAWGLCASAFCRNVLSAVAIAALLPLAAVWLLCGLTPLMGQGPKDLAAMLILSVGGRGVLALVALGVSAASFAGLDAEQRFETRPAAPRLGSAAPRTPLRTPLRWEALLWLMVRQGRGELAVMGGLGLALGLLVPVAGPALWAAATLLAGVVCGTGVFAGEQAEGANKFLGDQRLPMGWVWARKTGFWLAGAAAVAGLVLLGAVIHVGPSAVPKPGHPPATVAERWEALLGGSLDVTDVASQFAFAGMWLLNGFAVGQLCGLLWSKRAVAVVVAVLVGSGAAAVWMPSLLGGGLSPWQVVGVPVLLLAACRLVMWPWVTDRLAARPATLTLTAGALLALAWVALCFGYRVLEVPAAALARDPASHPADQEEVTQLVRDGLQEFEKLEHAPGDLGPPGMVARTRTWDVMERLLQQGWAGAPPELPPWLEGVCKPVWMKPLREAADLSPAVLADARSREITGDVRSCRKAVDVLTARGLQLQAAGKDAEGLDALVSALALSRALRNGALPPSYLMGAAGEAVALDGLDRWLGGVRDPKLLREALADLALHESAVPPVADCLRAEHDTFLRGLNEPAVQKSGTGLSKDTLALLVVIPWERGRAERLAGQVFAGRIRAAEAGDGPPVAAAAKTDAHDLLGDWLPAPDVSRERLAQLVSRSWLRDYLPPTENVQRAARLGQCRVRAARLQAALVLYRVRHGQPAPNLDALVPEFLPDLPADPYSGQSFRYRVSDGERLPWAHRLLGGQREFLRPVPAGQGILWSVGPDGVDDGGTRPWEPDVAGGPGRDILFLVP